MKKRIYVWLHHEFNDRKLALFAEIVILATAPYLLLKKFFDFSITDILKLHFSNDVAGGFLLITTTILIIAFIIRVIALIFDNNPPLSVDKIKLDDVTAFLASDNNDISVIIKKCKSQKHLSITEMYNEDIFYDKVALIIVSLVNHILKGATQIELEKNDIFISLYSYNRASNCLEYVAHNSLRYTVTSRTISLSHEKFSNYECVKCCNSVDIAQYVLKNESYHKGISKRYDTIKQYMGYKLTDERNDILFGFLNIEFHRLEPFNNEDEMKRFMEEYIAPFKLLLEQQYLKFDLSKQFEDHNKKLKVVQE